VESTKAVVTLSRGENAVPDSETQSRHDLPGEAVLTLAEAAAYLRVPEEAISELAAEHAIPAQKIGGEWRFLKRALADWLRFGPRFYQEFGRFPPPWILEHPFWDELFQVLEQRILNRLRPPEQPAAKRGSKQAVLKHFGVFQEDADLEEQLAGIRARRKGSG
jgi:excisionase family DNA binding protein